MKPAQKHITITNQQPKPGNTFLCCDSAHVAEHGARFFHVDPPAPVRSTDERSSGWIAREARFLAACEACLKAAGDDILAVPFRASGLCTRKMVGAIKIKAMDHDQGASA